LQAAGVMALGWGDDYYRHLSTEYAARRDHLLESLQTAGFQCHIPRGAYYVMTDITSFGFPDDITFVSYLIETVGIAAVPGSSFFSHSGDGRQKVRFCFCKKYETLELARRQLATIIK
jgi:aspartate/methionine/tyrosine aminotransferase